MTIVGLAPELSTILLFRDAVVVDVVVEVVMVVFVVVVIVVVDVVVESVVLVQSASIARSHGLLEGSCVSSSCNFILAWLHSSCGVAHWGAIQKD